MSIKLNSFCIPTADTETHKEEIKLRTFFRLNSIVHDFIEKLFAPTLSGLHRQLARRGASL